MSHHLLLANGEWRQGPRPYLSIFGNPEPVRYTSWLISSQQYDLNGAARGADDVDDVDDDGEGNAGADQVHGGHHNEYVDHRAGSARQKQCVCPQHYQHYSADDEQVRTNVEWPLLISSMSA